MEEVRPEDIPQGKELTFQTGALRFNATPYVRLEYHDMSPYRDTQPVRKIKETSGKYDVQLSQECRVSLRKEDLKQLKASFQRPKTEHLTKSLLKTYKAENTKTQKRVIFADHVIIHELKENHKCRKCPKIFEDHKSMKLHAKQCHKKRNYYICKYCNKKFVDEMFFKLHVKFHCDLCGNMFYSESQLLAHKQDGCKVYNLHKCKTCEQSFFKYTDLTDHNYYHMDLCYICDICKEQFKTKREIAHHIATLHSKKNLHPDLHPGDHRLILLQCSLKHQD